MTTSLRLYDWMSCFGNERTGKEGKEKEEEERREKRKKEERRKNHIYF